MKTIAASKGDLNSADQDLLATVQTFWQVESPQRADQLDPITPEELAGALDSEGLRKQFLMAMYVTALIDGEASPEEVAQIEAYAKALEVEATQVKNLHRLMKGHMKRLRFDMVRHSWVAHKIKNDVWPKHGLKGVLKTVFTILQKHEDPEVAARYRALEHYPEGSLGRGYYDMMIREGFAFPGEKGAPPEFMAIHDCTHILSGYMNTPQEEVFTAGFTVGYTQVNPAAMLLAVMLQFHLAVQIIPADPGRTGLFDVMGFMKAAQRGAQMNIDLISSGWDPWDVFDQPVDELRRRYNVPPRLD